jgi:hypothetical protein
MDIKCYWSNEGSTRSITFLIREIASSGWVCKLSERKILPFTLSTTQRQFSKVSAVGISTFAVAFDIVTMQNLRKCRTGIDKN